MSVGPAAVLSVLVGTFYTALYIFLRGSIGSRLPLLLVAAILGALAGDALGARMGVDLLRIGDFRLVAASVVAWLGIGFVEIVSILGPSRGRA